MFQTIFVYSSVMIFMTLFGIVASYRNLKNPHLKLSFFHWEVILPLCLFSVVFGLRYDVGVDHLSYLENYKYLYGVERFEPIFRYVTLVLSNHGIHYFFYFALWAILQVSLVFYSLKEERYLYPYLSISLFMGQFFWHWMNGIRQDLAACIFVFSVVYIANKRFFKYLLCCVVACGFHKTAIVLLPIYFIFIKKDDWINNRFCQYFILFVSFVVAFFEYDVLSPLLTLINYYSTLLNYEMYSESVLENFRDITNTGLSLYIFVVLDLFIIYYSSKLKSFYNNRKFCILYNLYYFGTVTQLFFANNMLLSRPFRYFRYFKMIILAYLLYYLFNKIRKSRYDILFLFLIILLLFLSFAAIIKNEPFYFIWDF